MSQTVITQPCYGAVHEITCHLFIYAALGATCRNWNEKSKFSRNVTNAKCVGRPFPHVPTPLQPWHYPFHTTKNAPCYGSNHKKCASLTAIARYITIIYSCQRHLETSFKRLESHLKRSIKPCLFLLIFSRWTLIIHKPDNIPACWQDYEQLTKIRTPCRLKKLSRWMIKTRHSKYSFALSTHSEVRNKP